MTTDAPARPADIGLISRQGLASRLRAATPAWKQALIGGLAWGGICGGSALWGLVAEGWQSMPRIALIVFLFSACGLIACPAAMFVARLMSNRRSPESAFAAAFVALAVLTIGSTSLVYALDYRNYYSEWHADPWSVTWMFQFLFTVGGAIYQFAVLGLRLYVPFGFAALFLFAIWFARQPR